MGPSLSTLIRTTEKEMVFLQNPGVLAEAIVILELLVVILLLNRSQPED